MGKDDAAPAVTAPATPPRRRRRPLRKALLAFALILGAGVLLVWYERFRIAETLIERELAARGIEASYRIEEITPTRQVLSQIVLGDPARPDLTIERLVVRITPRLGFPRITGIRAVRPVLRGSFRDGELSFGALDPLLLGEGEAPFAFPDLVLAIDDGRAWFATDAGAIGVSIDGDGHLRSGFAARLFAAAPALAAGGCALEVATLHGRVSIDAERPRFSGPLRFDALGCGGEGGVSIEGGKLTLALGAPRTLDRIDGRARIALGPLSVPDARLAALAGRGDFTWRAGGLTASYDLEGRDLVSGPIRIVDLESAGLLRARRNFARVQIEGELAGRGIAPGDDIEAALAAAQAAGEGTLAAPLLARIRRELASESRGSALAASYNARIEGERFALSVPEALVRGRSGAPLLTLSSGRLRAGPGEGGEEGGEGGPLLAGNFASRGTGLPRIAGRFAQGPGGTTQLDLVMAEYAAGLARLAVPELALARDAAGAWRFSGRLRASGPLPGGTAQALAVPLSGRWSEAGGLALWPDCTRFTFARLAIADLTLDGDALTLCPPRGSAIVESGPGGLNIAAGAPSLDLVGRIGGTRIAIASGPVGLAWPGTLTAGEVDVSLGPRETASRFTIEDLTANLSREIGGRFDGADISLNAVPLDLADASGRWRYAGNRLTLSDGAFTLLDRGEVDRFRPLAARDATLTLARNTITAVAALREPRTDALVTNVSLEHDLATGTGFADLVVPSLTFDDSLQPTDLTDLALGIVALVDGTVTGSGRIDWNERDTTSTGRFSADDLDFAAAFGPVEGASGTIVFTDLIGLTTAPDQRIRVRAFNPGIEVYGGEVAIGLREGTFVDLAGATWPFLGGTLTVRPLTLTLGAAEQRGYILDLSGLDVARFIERMELENLFATGLLDGTVPIIFGADGDGRIEGGFLQSRPPGGNLAYVGHLTYEDLTPVADFAFDTLRSLDYEEMRIGMDGSLSGELVTRVALEGVSQGAGTKRNFITRRLAEIPIRLLVNVRAPFYRLIASLRSLYDPSAVRDPRELGLVGPDGTIIRRETDADAVEALDDVREADIQRPESETPP